MGVRENPVAVEKAINRTADSLTRYSLYCSYYQAMHHQRKGGGGGGKEALFLPIAWRSITVNKEYGDLSTTRVSLFSIRKARGSQCVVRIDKLEWSSIVHIFLIHPQVELFNNAL